MLRPCCSQRRHTASVSATSSLVASVQVVILVLEAKLLRRMPRRSTRRSKAPTWFSSRLAWEVVCPPALAASAVAAGVGPERVVVEGASGSGAVADLVSTGWPVLVSLSDGPGELARAAVLGWLGVRVFRVQGVRETRRALRMVSAIRGDVPPASAVRGLA